MPNDKAGQPNRTAPHVTLRNADKSLPQRTDSKRSRQHVNEIQQHLIFDACKVTQLAVHAVCSPHTYQGTWLMLISLAGCIDVTGQTFVGSTTLAQRIGVDRDTTDAQLQRLHDAGIATIQGKQGRSYIRSIMLPCSHLDMYAESSAESSADTHADSYAESCADSYADTSPHYQITSRSHQDQQQVDVVVSYSLADRQAILSTINDGLPKDKQIKPTKALHDLFDSWQDNFMCSDEIIAQLHSKQTSWGGGGGTMTALKYITDRQAATQHERQPLPVINPCIELAADVECDTKTHTKLGSNEPVQQCPQRKRES
jgi:hypothetical protein